MRLNVLLVACCSWFSVHEVPLDKGDNGGCVDDFFTCGKYGFSSMMI